MALTLQRKLELAGALAKVQPELQRLHLLPARKKSHRLRNAILVGSVVVVGAALAAGVLRRRSAGDEALPDVEHDLDIENFPEHDSTAVAAETNGIA